MTIAETSVAHTPGPWHIEPAPSPASMKSIRSATGKAIAFVNRGPQAEFNALAIVALPDLYAALVGLTNALLDADWPIFSPELIDELALAQDAIAKAEGSQP